ncbi:MAG: hypothetical protein GY842_07360 [bacterium]|nr:hypothetical protein [bacterium]
MGRILSVVLLLATVHLARAWTQEPGDGNRDLIDELLAMPAPAPDWRIQARERNDALPVAKRDWFDGQPPEDAPTHVLLPYCVERARFGDELPPLTEKLREKLLQGSERRPGVLPEVLCLLPETPGAHGRVARLLEAAEQSGEQSEEWYATVRDWLALHSDRFRPQLIARARGARDEDGWVDGEEALRALAEKDWAAAQPILREHMAGDQPRVAAVSLALLYLHAMHSEGSATSRQLRNQLKRLVSDRSASGFVRHTACEVLMATEWPERDSWFLTLFSDPTISITGGWFTPLLYVVRVDPDYWIPHVATTVGGEDRAAHNAAVRCLEQFHLKDARADALRPLLPWLSYPKWAERRSSTDRLRLIQSLDRVDLPECIEGLVWVAGHDTGFALSAAAEALAHYCARDAVPVLKAALAREPDEYHRRRVIQAVLTLGGYSVEEKVVAVEAYAREIATEEGSERVTCASRSRGDAAPLAPEVSVGRYLGFYWDAPDEKVARRLMARVQELRTKDVLASQGLWLIIRTWPTVAVDQEIVRRVASDTVDRLSLRSALKRRASLRRNAREELEKLCGRGGAQLGIAACLIGEPERYAQVLDGADPAAQRALLACARLVRESLPLQKVGELLQSANDGVVSAAESYLESEDSTAARQLVLACHPGDARILGARQQFDPGHHSYARFERWEDRLREAVKADGGPDEIFALLSAGYWGDEGQRVVYVRGRNAELRFYRDETKHESRKLADKEWRDLRRFLSANLVEDLAPLNVQANDGIQYEYVHLTRHGGRRVFMNNPDTVGGSVYDQLARRFAGLSRSLEGLLAREEEKP